MKKLLVVVVVIAIALLGANAAMAAIAGSKHDLSNGSGNAIRETTAGLSSCQFCHAPHGASTYAGAPLWNRTIKAVSSYTVYGASNGSVTLGGTSTANLGPNSLTCLSCHDGTLSVGDTLVNGSRTMTGSPAGIVTGLNNIGVDLGNDHPVGLVVDTTKAGLASMATMTAANFKFYGAANNEMQCATCHDPHGVGNPFFLRAAQATLCSTCHASK